MASDAVASLADVFGPKEEDLGDLDLTGVFDLLSNETRLGIVQALAKRNGADGHAPALTFSELRERVGTRDPGQFNYHLQRLRGNLVEKTADGYELTELGLVVGSTVVESTV